MIHTNRCKHCGKTKEHHFFTFIPNQSGFCDHASRRGDLPRMYQDSGLAALDAHKEELYEISMEIKNATKYFNGDTHVAIPITIFKKLQLILNQIEKEK